MTHPLESVREAELRGLARVAGRLFAGPAQRIQGSHPHHFRAGSGSEFLDFRELQPGDAPRDVDWRATARSPRPQVRRYRDERSADWMLCLDRSASMGVSDDRKWALAIQLTAALAYLLLYLNHRVGLILFSTDADDLCRPGRGRTAYGALLRLLRTATPAESGGASRLEACLPHVRAGARVLVIGDFLAPDAMTGAISKLDQIGEQLQAFQILDPADHSIPAEGAIGLQDIESGQRMSILLHAGIQQRTKQRLLLLTEQLNHFCRRRHIAFTGCNTGTHWKEVLLSHLRNLEASHA